MRRWASRGAWQRGGLHGSQASPQSPTSSHETPPSAARSRADGHCEAATSPRAERTRDTCRRPPLGRHGARLLSQSTLLNRQRPHCLNKGSQPLGRAPAPAPVPWPAGNRAAQEVSSERANLHPCPQPPPSPSVTASAPPQTSGH